MSDTPALHQGPVRGHVVGQFFGIFHGCSKEHFSKIVASAPFECCNLLILAFVGLWGERSDNENFWIPLFLNGRDNQFHGGTAKPGDLDDERVRLVIKTAREKNPAIKILVSMGWYNEVTRASAAPEKFAEGLARLVQTYGLDGFDIDYEPTQDVPKEDGLTAGKFITLMTRVKTELGRVTKEAPILTITPAMTDVLTKEVLDCFTYVMPQSYGHNSNTTAWQYQQILNSYDAIVWGLMGEGYKDSKNPLTRPDDPDGGSFYNVRANRAAGMFSWRLDTDSMVKLETPTSPAPGDDEMPTFEVAKKMWLLMKGL